MEPYNPNLLCPTRYKDPERVRHYQDPYRVAFRLRDMAGPIVFVMHKGFRSATLATEHAQVFLARWRQRYTDYLAAKAEEAAAAAKAIEFAPDFWDCECEEDYIHPKMVDSCPKCGALKDNQPDSRLDEVRAQFAYLKGLAEAEAMGAPQEE